jgi:hypothetical protein
MAQPAVITATADSLLRHLPAGSMSTRATFSAISTAAWCCGAQCRFE